MEGSNYMMWMKRKQILEAPFIHDNNNYCSWEERAFAEDAARILGGNIWPPRSYSCTFCKREFKSAQALGGHMNIHRRDRARLKQNHSLHKNDFNSLCNNHHLSEAEVSSQRDSTIPTTRTVISTNSEAKRVMVNAREDIFNDYVETSLSMGLNSNYSVFGQKSPSVTNCGDQSVIRCKRMKSSISSSLPEFFKPCSSERGIVLQPKEIVLGINPGIVEDLDLELRLGKHQKVN